MSRIAQFITDFKKSRLYTDVLNDPKAEPIMIWVTGSSALGTADNDSDYDVCILVEKVPQDNPDSPWTIYGRPGSYFMWYKPHSKRVEWIYTDINDIVSANVVTPLANIGWVQSKFITDENIIYKNPKYLEFLNLLFSKKDEIYTKSLYLFVKSAINQTINGDLNELILEDTARPNKLLAHICFTADLLQKKELNNDYLVTIKRNKYSDLSDEIKKYIKNAIDYLSQLKDLEHKINSDTLLEDLLNVLAFIK